MDNTKKVNLFRYGVIIGFFAFFSDQLTKILVKNSGQQDILQGPIDVSIGGTYNPFFAFSLPAPTWVILLTVMPIFLLVFIYWAISAWKGKVESLWIALILGGGAGNLLDRIDHEGVYDWIELSLASFHWSSFNLADIWIVIGVIGWLVYTSRRNQQTL